MKLKVKVADQVFEVEIEDVHARPVQARIGDELFEIWPEAMAEPVAVSAPSPKPPPQRHTAPNGAAPRPSAAADDSVLAPLPGVLISVAVQPGDQVAVGQRLCVLEAMKMNNTIRAARAGRITAVRVAVGQTVRHRQVLLEYEPASAGGH